MKNRTSSEAPRQPLPDGRLTLRLLGEPALFVTDAAGVERRLLGVGKPLALLTYLAIAPQREASREFLADLLWAGGSVVDPAHSLRNALVSLRNIVGADLLEATDSRCRLTRAIGSDLDVLNGALRDGRLRDVVARYTGEFFAEFAAPGCVAFEHWSESVRHRTRTDVANAADVLVRQLLDAGHPRDAAAIARRMTEVEPLGQRSRRALVEALVAAGDSLGALTEVSVLEQWLDAEGLDAEPATSALIAQVRKARGNGRHRESGEPAAPTPDLVGRESAFAEILAAWDRAKGSGPAFVAVTAAAGVGKTRLLADIGNRLRAERARVVAVGALQSERDLPFALLAALVAELAPLVESSAVLPSTARVLAGLDPALAERYNVAPDVSPTDLTLRRALALRELLTCVAERRSTALILDDLHWADESSADAILAALTRLTDAHVLVLAAARPGARPAVPLERANALTLHPLLEEQMEQLVASIRPLPAAPWAGSICRALHAASGGIPLFAILALRSAEDAGLLIAGELEWECGSPSAAVRFLMQGSVASQSLKDVSPTAMRLLGHLALSGRELSRLMLAAALSEDEDGAGDIDSAIGELERRALASRLGDRIAISHDLVAEAVLTHLSGDDRRRWCLDLAKAMMATGDSRWVERGARLAASVVSPAELASLLAPVLASLPFVHGESLDQRLTGWFGQAPAPRRLAMDVARHLPLRLRLRPYRRRVRAAAFALLALAASLTIWFRRPVEEPSATLRVLTSRTTGTYEALDVPLFTNAWSVADPLTGTTSRIRGDSGQSNGQWNGQVISLRAHARLVEQAFDDSGGTDVVSVDADGRRTRLTDSPGDDVPSGWSPDGRYVVLASSRWSEVRHHRIAVLDTRTHRVRPVGRGDGLEGGAQWSPDGSRIAFMRRHLDGRPQELCVVDFDGANESCATPANPRSPDLTGWANAGQLVASGLDISGQPSVWLIVPDSGWAARALLSVAYSATMSPNAEFLAWREQAASTSTVRVAPISDLSRARVVRSDTDRGASVLATWTMRGSPSPFVDSLFFAPGGDSIVVGVPYRPQLMAHWSDGRISIASHLRWKVTPTVSAVIDEHGTMLSTAAGSVLVTASIGGWRTATHRFTVVPRRSSVLVAERWDGGTRRWRLFGDPKPEIVRDRLLGPALSNRGDGTYFSGAYLQDRLALGSGIAVELDLRTPVTELEWQSLGVQLLALVDDGELARWDHRSGYFPVVGPRSGLSACSLQYPGAEGAVGREHVTTAIESDVVRPFDARTLGRGRPWRLRLQVLPDGRCGVAVNGRVLGVSEARLSPSDPLLLVTYGSAWRTQMLVGPVTVSRGVPGGVDWASYSRPAAATATNTTPRSRK